MQDMMKLISVVIPCYNHGQYLVEAVDSVLAQTYSHLEIVIVNDGSTDTNTKNVLNTFDKPKCKVLHTDNQGLSAARNNGIRSSKGEYICCLDADDKYHPEYFSKAIDVFENDTECRYGAVPAWVQFFGSSNSLWKTLGHNVEGFEPFLQGLRNNIQSATMFRRRCWEEVGGFDESMTLGYEDWDFWIKMLDFGYKWFCLEEPLIYYRQKEQSMVTRADQVRSSILKELIENNNTFYTKHMVSMLLARDEEVLLLQRENMLLKEQLSTSSSNNSRSSRKSGAKTFRALVQQVLKK